MITEHKKGGWKTHSAIAAVAEFLAHQLVRPVFGFAAGAGHEAWYYERHVAYL